MATCKDCLHYEACKDIVECLRLKVKPDYLDSPGTENDCLTFQPKTDYVKRERGEWIFKRGCYEADECNCSICGQLLTTHVKERANFCPNCGADMRGSNNA